MDYGVGLSQNYAQHTRGNHKPTPNSLLFRFSFHNTNLSKIVGLADPPQGSPSHEIGFFFFFFEKLKKKMVYFVL